MRIEIKTKGRVKDPDIKALYLINYAMKICTDKMRQATIDFIISKWRKP